LTTRDPDVVTLSCSSAGNCGGAGYYLLPKGGSEVFVVTEANGTWGNAAEVPGMASLNTGLEAFPTFVSCPAAGKCAAVGYYREQSGRFEAFVVSQT